MPPINTSSTPTIVIGHLIGQLVKVGLNGGELDS
jgi:hypothetical protein